MAASDMMNSIDRAVAEMRREHEEERAACEKARTLAEVENVLLKDQLMQARADCAKWQRIATQFVTQFDTIDRVCADVRAAAIAVRDEQHHDEYRQDQDAGNSNAVSSDISETGQSLCMICGGVGPGNETTIVHRDECPERNFSSDDNEPLPQFLSGAQLTEPPPMPSPIQPPRLKRRQPDTSEA